MVTTPKTSIAALPTTIGSPQPGPPGSAVYPATPANSEETSARDMDAWVGAPVRSITSAQIMSTTAAAPAPAVVMIERESTQAHTAGTRPSSSSTDATTVAVVTEFCTDQAGAFSSTTSATASTRSS